MKTFGVGWVLKTLAAQEGLNVVAEGIDDVCFGLTISSDKTADQVFRENSALYNYQIVDGNPIRLVRRTVNDSLVIDVEINEVDCIRRGQAPAVSFSRVDPATLPRQVEVQHVDPARDYAVSTQVARHTAAPRTNTQISIPTDFIISAQQARDMAFDLLYRLWAQQLSLSFEHPNLRIDPGTTIRLTTGRGVFVIQVTGNTINMPARTNTINATILLASKGVTVAAPEADPFSVNAVAILTEDSTSPVIEWTTEDDIPILTEG
jgi:hypothetical protein